MNNPRLHMVAERGSVANSPSKRTSAATETPQNRPSRGRDEFDVHSSDDEPSRSIAEFKIPKIVRDEIDDDTISIHGETVQSIFGANSKPFKRIEKKDSLTVIVDNGSGNGESKQLKSAVVVPSRSKHNPFRSNRGQFRQANRSNRENRQTFRNNSHQNKGNRQLPLNRNRVQVEQFPANDTVTPVVPSQGSCPCAHSCNSKSVSLPANDGKITIGIADLQKILDAKATPKTKAKRGLSSGQRKRLKKAAENKLKRELGFDKWWELMRAQESKKKGNQ